MPIIEVNVAQGRSPNQIRELITSVTDAVERVLGVARTSIRVIVHEIPKTNWAAGDITLAEREGT